MEILLATTTKIMTKGYIWSDFKHHSTVNFYVCIFGNTTIILAKVDTRRTSDKAIILQSCILDVLLRHRNIIAGKGLNLFDQWPTRCVYLSLQEEEPASFS